MKKVFTSLTLACLLVLALCTWAQASDAPLALRVTVNGQTMGSSGLLLDPEESRTALAAIQPNDDNRPLAWRSSDSNIVSVTSSTDGRTGFIKGLNPGKATVTVSADGITPVNFEVTVSGIVTATDSITIKENEAVLLANVAELGLQTFGAVDGNASFTIATDKANVARATGRTLANLTVDGVAPGIARITITSTVGSKSYQKSFSVTVESNEAEPIRGDASTTNPLKFSTLESKIAAQCKELISGENNTLASITGVRVSPNEGILYLNYKSPEDPGAGAGSAVTYYPASAARGPYISDLVFVPNALYRGETATITFTGTSAGGRTFKGKILVTLEAASTDLTITADHGNPVKLSGTMFDKLCQDTTGTSLDYVIFTLPNANQGALYRDYVNNLNYGSKVNATDQYKTRDINTVTFVPANGYVGRVTIGYAGYSAGGQKFNGELIVNVTQSLDAAISYNDNGSRRIGFRAEDFSRFCGAATGGSIDYVKFTLPAYSQGTLYYGGAAAEENKEYKLSDLSALSFAAADGFSGTVRIPFAGFDLAANPFNGTVELHFQSSTSSSGDITYVCKPGDFVKLSVTDFNNLCQTLTGGRLHYITFPSLPDLTVGTLYHNKTSTNGIGTRVGRDIKYYQSTTPYLTHLSFWATDNFQGSVEIPFNGASVSGSTFSGLMVISTSGGQGTSTSAPSAVTYTTSGRQPVKFQGADFEAFSRSASNAALNYVRFTPPAANQGMLYYNYQSEDAPTAVSDDTSYYLNGQYSVGKITFVPSAGFSGDVDIPFEGCSISGGQFQGTVRISVRNATAGTSVRYETFGSPVKFKAEDFLAVAGSNRPASIRFSAVSDKDNLSGKLFYQYQTPILYGALASTTVDYAMSGQNPVSSLSFVPKAGYRGTVTLPYTATNSDGTQYTGQVVINVDSPLYSSYFNDLYGANTDTLAAVDFLYTQEVVNGMSPGQYGPQLSIRRGDFCLMLFRAFQFAGAGTTQSFRDVPGDAYYAQAVNTLRSLGIVDGVGGNLFMPDGTLSRQDASLMVQRTLRTAGLPAADGNAGVLTNYPDGQQVATYAVGGVACMVEQGLLPDVYGQLAPAAPLTRADMAVLLHRAMTK